MKTVKEIIINALYFSCDDFNMLYKEYGDGVCIYGRNGLLDSIDLVRFTIEVEFSIKTEYDKYITIVSDKIFSLSNSPFKDITTFESYINELLK